MSPLSFYGIGLDRFDPISTVARSFKSLKILVEAKKSGGVPWRESLKVIKNIELKNVMQKIVKKTILIIISTATAFSCYISKETYASINLK